MTDTAWVWKALTEDEDRMSIWAVFDENEPSNIDSSEFRYNPSADPKIFPPPSQWIDPAVFRTRQFRTSTVEAISCIPTTTSSPLVDKKLIQVIETLVPSNEVFFYPATVKTSDGETKKYNLVVPLLAKECIDISQCEGVGRMPDINPDKVWGYRTAKHFNDCLLDKNMIRDLVYPGNIVISDKLKRALEATGDAGLAFHKIEKIHEVGYYES